MFKPREPNARPAVETWTTQYRNLLTEQPPPLTDEPYQSPNDNPETGPAGDAATNEGMGNPK